MSEDKKAEKDEAYKKCVTDFKPEFGEACSEKLFSSLCELDGVYW